MRIVIDLQGAQSASRFRGIGRYSLALALGVARNAGEHEVWLVLNAALGSAIDDIRQAFSGLVPPGRICVFDIAGPTAEVQASNSPRARAGELLREHAIAQLRPDAVLVTSLFEGYVDDAVVSIGRLADGATTSAILYDLIPFLNPQQYLRHPEQRAYYERKVASLREAGLLLAISDYSRQEAIDALGLDPARVVSISTAVDETFHPGALDAAHVAALRARFGITRAALMCAPGGFDSRKNIAGLVAAYGMLPSTQRAGHQLVIAGKSNDEERQHLQELARKHGLGADELVLTGYVSDADLIDLYRTAALFVFPSLHEGFGLPALEAMACGALVIGADSTSIPEVIGNPEALFDPRDPAAIAAKIGQVLGDPALQARLRARGTVQARKFSWDNSARRAIAALEAYVAQRAAAAAAPAPPQAPAPAKPRIAYVSPLPPERTGIADHSARVLATLLPWFDVELIVNQATVHLPADVAHLPHYPPSWLDQHPDRYEHIVYHFGNSPFHSHMIPLLQRHPGVVALHDFFLSSMISYEQITGGMPGAWTRSLLHSHGYAAVQASVAPENLERARQDYPCNLEILQDATHVVVHSDYARQLAQDWYGPEAGRDWSLTQLPRAVPAVNDRAAARLALGIAADAFVVCNFGFIAPTKLCLELLQAFLDSSLRRDARCHLIFIGENHGGDYGRQITETIAAAHAGEQVRITGWTSDENYLHYLQAADVAVQLRTGSRGETSSTAPDCMIYGLPVVINANGAMAEFPHDAVWMLPDSFEQRQLVDALETLHDDETRRRALGAAGFALMASRNSPERVGLSYKDTFERAAAKRRHGRPALLRALLATPGLEADDAMLQRLARCISHAPDPLQPRQLLLDVTTISRNDLKSGIERVVRNQLLELMQLRAVGYRVEPVYLDSVDGQAQYRYARNYAARLLGIEQVLQGPDPVVDVQAGDIFYGADYSTHATMAAAGSGLYAAWRARGVTINFLVHDLLPVLRPEFFPPHSDTTHAAWLDCIAAEGDCLIGVSRAVRDELLAWLAGRDLRRRPGQVVTALHHGADLELRAPPDAAPAPVVQQVAARPSFLVVGTIEPRKGHLQALEAFEQLWADGVDVNLVIVGREGWTSLPDAERRTLPRIMQRLRASPELGKRLLWLDGIDDDTLQHVYRASACLLFPSEGEGFGLPLIEAAHQGLPLLARDLPVFREVAGASAHYFSGMDGAALAGAVRAWLGLHAEGRHPTPGGMRWMTWKEQAGALLALLTDNRHVLSAAPPRARQLLLDVTTIARNDLKTGIERLVRNQLMKLLQLRATGVRVEPVYLDSAGGRPQFRYARNYAERLVGVEQLLQGAEPLVEVQEGDIYYGADYAPGPVMEAARAGLYAAWRARGVSINFTVYDLLPVQRPEFFPLHADVAHAAWLDCVAAEADRLICISQAVCDDLAGWLAQRGVARRPGQLLTSLHLGADLELQAAADAVPAPVVQQVAARPSFLMVGTIEPRKGHLQALEAFEQLWAAGEDVNLVIVGCEGWKPLADPDRRTLPRIMQRLRASPELGQRLLWLDGVDDDTLQQVYHASTCLLFPSEGEGFGLPLIEAAHHGLPLLARDIPVFREVAGANAHYFSGMDGAALAGAVRAWLALHAEGRHPTPDGMLWMTWEEQARALLTVLKEPLLESIQ